MLVKTKPWQQSKQSSLVAETTRLLNSYKRKFLVLASQTHVPPHVADLM